MSDTNETSTSVGTTPDIEDLIKKIPNYKGYLTRIKNEFEENKGKNFKLEKIGSKIDKITDNFQKIVIMRKIFSEASPPEEEKKTELDELIKGYKEMEVSYTNQFHSQCPSSENHLNEKLKSLVSDYTSKPLPEISLPIFSAGLYEDWGNFKIQFESFISSNPRLSDSQKLFYLQTALRGEAKIIKSVGDTYDSLFSALGKHFDSSNKRLFVDSHISSILNYDGIQDPSRDLRSFVDCIKRTIKALSVLERNKLSDALIINAILQKLDEESKVQFELTLNSNQSPELDKLISFLEVRISHLQSINRNQAASDAVSELSGDFQMLNVETEINSSNPNGKRMCLLSEIWRDVEFISSIIELSNNS